MATTKVKLKTTIFSGFPIPPKKEYLTFKELDQNQQEFFYFLLEYIQVSAKPKPNTAVGSLCSYIQECMEGQDKLENARLELYDFLTWRE